MWLSPAPLWRRSLLLLFLLTATPALWGQGPDAEWRTLETPGYRFHYPAPAEAWTLGVAERMDAIRARVAEEVGYSPTETVDVLVVDPVARANGTAWPILGWPRMRLFTSPPPPDSVLGHYQDWSQVLAVHEDAHLAHLLRPSRRPLRRIASKLVPLGPIPAAAPNWMIEGYATWIEGELTGWGRPHGDFRASLLRRWAQAGELPSYGQLNGDGRRWLGLSMPYLVGSAYVGWLMDRTGPDSLRNLWARMTARSPRSFDGAFRGVFGDTPRRLYNRFCAELTYRAMALEEEMAPTAVEGELWQELSWRPSAPALSPDGGRMAVVLRSWGGPSRLVVWSTGDDVDARRRWRERRRALVEADPEDVPAIPKDPLPRKPLHQLVTRDGAEPRGPRWSGDGRSLVYVRLEPDAAGRLRSDLFRWTPESGRVERITEDADLRDPDPAPEGDWAVAVRQRWGRSQLVRVDLATARVEPLGEATLDVVAHPRLDPSGERLAYVVHRGDGWRLVVRNLVDGTEKDMATPPRGQVAFPAWGPGGKLFVTLGEGGFLDVHAFDPRAGFGRRITLSHGAALAPAPSADGLFYLSLDVDGFDLRRLDLGAAPEPGPFTVAGREDRFAPAVRPGLPAELAPLANEPLAKPRPYGVGRLEILPLLGGHWGPGGGSLEAGVRAGDLLGRLQLMVMAADSDSSFDGLALMGRRRGQSWLGRPLELGLHLFDVEELPSEAGDDLSPLAPAPFDRRARGGEASADWLHRGRRLSWRLRGGALVGSVEPAAGDDLSRRQLFLGASVRTRRIVGPWRFRQEAGLGGAWGETDEDSWTRTGGRLRAEVERAPRGALAVGLGVEWAGRRIDGPSAMSGGGLGPADRLRLGGRRGSLLPASALGGRILEPALPPGTLEGTRHESQGVEVSLGRLTVFHRRHRLWDRGAAKGDWLDLRGAELVFARGADPLLRLPAFDLTLGVAEILDPPLDDEVEAWFGFSWRP